MRTKKKGIGKKGRIEIDKWMEAVRLIRDNANRPKSIIDKSDVPFDVRNTIIDVIQPTQLVHKFYTNPEFFSHGSAFDTLLNPRRVVFGNREPHGDLTLLHHIYNFVPENNRLVINNARGVDFAKIYCNALLGCMGTLANIGSTFADDLKIDINQVFRIVDSEHRLGHGFLEPNVAVGGPALQRDIAYMAYMAEKGGHKEIATLFKGFIEVNKKRKEKFVKKMLKCMHSLKDKTIVILGFAYKAGTEDVSDSPSIYICEQLMRNEDVTLRVHDPIVSDEIIRRCLKANGAREQNLHVLPLRDQLFVDADAICIMTRAQEYLPVNLPYQNIVQLMRNPAYFFDFTGNDDFNLQDLEYIGFHNVYSSGRQ